MTQLVTPTAPSPKADRNSENAPIETVVLDVQGMMCAGCVSTVEKKLAQCEGVQAATVNLVTEVAAVSCTREASPEAIAQALTEAGYPSKIRATDSSSPLAAEADWLSRKEQAQKDQKKQVIVALVLLALSTIGHLEHFQWADGFSIPILSTLWFHGALATLTLIFPARKILIEGFQGAQRGAPNMNTLVSLGAISAYSTSLAALVFPGLGWECFFDEPVMLLSFILLGRTLEQRARFQAASSLRSLIALQPTLARLVPAPNLSKSDEPSEHLSSNEPQTGEPQTGEAAGVQIPAGQVQVGEWLQVLPSEKIPVDGVIALGQTTVDESMLTGESVSVVKQAGDEVVAGSLNQSGAITIQVLRTGLDTTLAQMIHLVETAQTRKAPIQGLADIISGYFTYGVLTCSALTFCFWFFIGVPAWPDVAAVAMGHMHHGATASHQMAGEMAGEMAEEMAAEMTGEMTGEMMGQTSDLAISEQSLRLLVSLKLAIAVVVVACPCALGLATPTAILVGSGMGAQQGLLIRGGDILEAARGLDTLIFDKTGTLTTGKPLLTDCQSLVPEIARDRLLQIAATVESGTRHPLGLAIQQAAAQQNLSMLQAQDFSTQAGFGIAAQVDQVGLVLLGNSAWMEKNGCAMDSKVQAIAKALGEAGKTAVFVAQEKQIVGVIGVADSLRPDAIETIEQLRQLDISVQILSGDSRAAAMAIAAELGLSDSQVQAEVTPQGKLDAIAALQKNGHRVGLVGDGINDAPALAQADVGIALNSGTDVAMETADIVLMQDALGDAIAAIKLSRATFNKIRQNLAWAFTYNLICIPLAAGAFLPAFGLSLNPGFAGGLMALSSVTVVLNSLLLKLHRP